jgi:hypothetical protein
MKNLLKIAFGIIAITSLTACTVYSDPYADSYGNPSYDNGYYYAPQGYYGGGGYWGNDGYYYRNNMNYYYDNGIPYYYQNYNNSRRKVYVERRSNGNGQTTSQRPNNGFRGGVNDGTSNGGFRPNNGQNSGQRPNNGFNNQPQNTPRPQNNNGGFRNNSSSNNNSNNNNSNGGFRNNSSTNNSNSNSGGFRNSPPQPQQSSPQPQQTAPQPTRSNGGGFR